MMPERPRFVAWLLPLLLIAIGAWRIVAVVGAQPTLGYANQFDMGRTSACVGLWPDLPEPARYEAHPQAPIARYVRGQVRPGECYFSSEVAFAWAARALAPPTPPDATIDLRLVGTIKGIVLVAAALAFNALLRRRPAWALTHAAVFAIVICDPMNTLWMNTLYTEFSALLGVYAVTTLLAVIAARDPQAPPAPIVVTTFAASLVFLGLTRQQHLLLPAVLALPACISLWPIARRPALALLVLVVVIAFIQLGAIGRSPTITAANNADVVLGAILPASRDPAATARILDLPQRCLQSTGASWYETMGESLQSTCPEALTMPRSHLAWLALSEPGTIARAVLRGAPQLQDWRLGYMGAVEGREFAGAETVRAVAGPAAFSAAPLVTALPPTAFALLMCGSLAGLLSSAGACFAALRQRRTAPLAVVFFATTATAWYAIATSILGDGYVEIPRHAQLAAPAIFAGAVIGVLAALRYAAGAVRGRAVFTTRSVVWCGIAVVLTLLLQRATQTAMDAMPMATGVVDRPRQNIVPRDAIEFAGWALDPQGVDRVELVTPTATYAAEYGLAYAGGRGESLALYFPTYPQAAHGGFNARLPAAALAQGAVDVRVVVINRAGVRTEIDRRRLVAAP